MFDWLRRILGRFDGGPPEPFHETLDALNAQAGGGTPVPAMLTIGRLRLRSGTLVLGDPQYVPALQIPTAGATEVEISAEFLRYPSGAAIITTLILSLNEPGPGSTQRKVGELGIDSARLVVADKADIEEYWTETGPDRIGVISTAPDDTVLRLLTKRFQLKTRRVNDVRAEVVGPVSEQLEAEIESFLQADQRYSKFPFMHFYVQTNNSFERINFMDYEWQFIPVGNSPEPLMFACGTGRGDGCYAVHGQFDEDTPRVLRVNFIEG